MKIRYQIGLSIGMLLGLSTGLHAQHLYAKDAKLQADILHSGIVHAPLRLDDSLSLETAGLRKPLLKSRALSSDFNRWTSEGVGQIQFSKAIDPEGTMLLTLPTKRDSWAGKN